MRLWMIRRRQELEITYPELEADIVKRAEFLLTFESTFTGEENNQRRSFQAMRLRRQWKSSRKIPFHSSSSSSSSDEQMDLQSECVTFLQSSVSVTALEERMQARAKTVANKLKSLQMIDKFVKSGSSFSSSAVVCNGLVQNIFSLCRNLQEPRFRAPDERVQ